MADESTWLKHQHPHYAANSRKWTYAMAHLDGSVMDAVDAGTYDGARLTSNLHGGTPLPGLVRRRQGETEGGFLERRQIADYTPHYARACTTLAGMLYAVSDQTSRQWQPVGEDGEPEGDGLGSPSDRSTPAGRLWHDADGRGTNWLTLWKQASIDIIAVQEMWCLVEGVRRDEQGREVGGPTLRLIPPTCVLDWIEEGGRLVEVKVKEQVDRRTSVRQKSDAHDRYFIYRLDGVTIAEEVERGGNKVVVEETRPYGSPDGAGFRYWADPERRVPALPIFRVQLPFRTQVGYLMARKANAIFNQESALDFLLWIACFPKLFADVQDENGNLLSDLWKEFEKKVAEGSNLLPGAGHKYDAPPTGPAEIKHKILQAKVEAFFTSFFQAYGDAARERTATEIRQDFRAGVEAFLTLLTGTLDELENGALWRLSQVEFPDQPDLWGNAHVTRSTNFQPVDIEARIESLVQMTMPGGRVPVDTETAVEIAVKFLESKGLAIGDERKELLRAATQSAMDRVAQGRSILQDFNL